MNSSRPAEAGCVALELPTSRDVANIVGNFLRLATSIQKHRDYNTKPSQRRALARGCCSKHGKLLFKYQVAGVVRPFGMSTVSVLYCISAPRFTEVMIFTVSGTTKFWVSKAPPPGFASSQRCAVERPGARRVGLISLSAARLRQCKRFLGLSSGAHLFVLLDMFAWKSRNDDCCCTVACGLLSLLLAGQNCEGHATALHLPLTPSG